MIYCVVPSALAQKLHEQLRAHFAADARVEVIVEQRRRERRTSPERRHRAGDREMEGDRRRVRNAGGRRIGSRRAPVVPVDGLTLPRKASPYADRLVFVERIEPSHEHLADLEAGRLVTRAQSGDEEAFATLYMRYFDRVYGYLRAIFRQDPHEAEDLTQHVFMRAFEALPRYERRSQPFRAWLFTIVRNVARSRLRQWSRSEPVEPHLLEERSGKGSPEEAASVLSWLTDRELMMFVERLPLAQRQVLVLRYMLDLPAREIASILGRSYDDVRALESRALRFLEARLTAIGRRADYCRRPLPTYGRTRWMRVARRRRAALRRNPGRVGM